MKKNTVEYWLNKLDEPFRRQALAQVEDNNTLNFYAVDERDALSKAFYWKDSNEGYDYWAVLFGVL